MFRIAVIGSHSTGKSTLSEALSTALHTRGQRCHHSEEPIHAIAHRLGGVDARTKFLMLIGEHFRRLDASDAEILILDRSLLDLRVYLQLDYAKEMVLADLVDALLPGYLGRLDLIFQLHLDIPLVPDGRRPVSEEYRRKVDAGLRNQVEVHGLQTVSLRGTPDERLHRALTVIDERRDTIRGRAGSGN